MGFSVPTQQVGRRWPRVPHALMLLGLVLFLFGCDPGGSPGSLSTPDGPSAPAEQQAIERLLGLYRAAVLEEDIDRLQALLQPAPALAMAATRRPVRPAASGAFADLAAFRQALSTTFTSQQIPPVLVSLDPATGQGTAIARTDLPTRADALAFTADGRLVVAGRDRNLYQLDLATGASTLIGLTGVEFIRGMSLRVLR